MSQVARKFASGSIMSGVAMAGLVFIPTQARADCNTDTVSCAVENGYGGDLEGVADIEYYENGCVAQWDCEYDDGTTIRYLVPN